LAVCASARLAGDSLDTLFCDADECQCFLEEVAEAGLDAVSANAVSPPLTTAFSASVLDYTVDHGAGVKK